ncbi:MAG: YdcF family protein [Anaerolineae bacterium]|nr:YdcF family protein [Anaerolineae bacterium]
MDRQRHDAAQTLYDYLALRDASVGPADLIIGFGHFDLKIPRQCGALWRAERAPRILFTGGVGAGTAGLDQPEAVYFRDEVLRHCPEIPESTILVEASSRHTGENVARSTALLKAVSPEACFDRGIDRVILVATAARQRRVWLTCTKHWPHLSLENLPPHATYAQDLALFAEKGRDLDALLLGEVERLLTYPSLGYIAQPDIPREVLDAYRMLRQ